MESNEVLKKLNERVKELSCLYALSKVTAQANLDLDSFIRKTLNLIPQGWQKPQLLNVCIKIDDQIYGDKTNSSTGQYSNINIKERKRGTVYVAYSKEAEKKIGYLIEEQQLLNQVAHEIGIFLERIEQKEKELIVQEKLKMDDRLNILGELTAGIAHELNTPLGNIMGYAELLKKNVIHKEQQKDLEKIVTSALNAREIVKKLMYFSCEMPTHFNLVKVNEIIVSTVDLLKLRLREKNIKVDTNDIKSTREVRGDDLQLSQIFINLIMNAITASKINGSIIIKTFEDKDSVIIHIKDYGAGIKKEDIGKIFQPFYTTTKGGTGLGLSVVHGIIQNHGGEIKVESEPNKGSLFKIKIPINSN